MRLAMFSAIRWWILSVRGSQHWSLLLVIESGARHRGAFPPSARTESCEREGLVFSMEAEDAPSERFGWFYEADGQFSETYVTWPSGTPDAVMERLKIAGFAEAPILDSGHKVGLVVYSRDEAARQRIRGAGAAGSAQVDVIQR